MDLELQRISSGPDCTQGVIVLPDSTVLYTLELPWVPEDGFPGGAPDRSCVPAGKYDLALHDTPKHPKSFALVNRDLGVIHEPDPTFPNARVACLIHVANYVSQLEGCIGVGLAYSHCEISSSAAALALLNKFLPWVAGNTVNIVGET